MTTYYRAKLELEEVHVKAIDQGSGYRTDREWTITSITLTDATPGAVIAQMCDHVDTLRRAGLDSAPTTQEQP